MNIFISMPYQEETYWYVNFKLKTDGQYQY